MATWTFDPTTGRYADGRGALVPAARVTAALDRVIADTQTQLAVLGQRRAEGMNTAEWRLAVQGVLKQGHVTAGALAHGGLDQLDPSTRGFIGARLRSQYSYLSGLALDTAPGDFSGADMARLGQYGNAAIRGTFSGVMRRDAEGRGEDEERNVLGGSSASCEECIALADAGWVPLGSTPELGSRTCAGNDNCVIETRSAAAAGVEA
jgi:hypothetical protein